MLFLVRNFYIIKHYIFFTSIIFQLMAAAMNAATLALMDSGLPLQCLVAAVTCLVDKDDKIILDPSFQIVNVIIVTFLLNERFIVIIILIIFYF